MRPQGRHDARRSVVADTAQEVRQRKRREAIL